MFLSSYLSHAKYFNSQPHKEADYHGSGVPMIRGISTHSLTRRLTIIEGSKHIVYDISTHSLTRRLTRTFWQNYPDTPFQLTASQGG